MGFDDLLEISPYSISNDDKEKLLTERLLELTEHHRQNCPEYEAILSSVMYDRKSIKTYKDIPFLPVRLFKELSLKSVTDAKVFKTMTSSGTSGQAVSRIYLDRNTSANQQKAMVKIVNDFTGSSRMPMIIIDCPSVVKDRKMFSARGAGILGFSIFGSSKFYALNDDMQLDLEGLKTFLETHKNERILIFGFTFMIWQYLYRELVRINKDGTKLDLSNAVMIHGGGWKKLVSEAVEPEEFKRRLKDVCGLEDIHDYYGMVEQTGCIYMQCEYGHLHASVFSDVITRRAMDFSECNIGEPGIIQVVSTIPESYPGHLLLTEDEGVILGVDECPCGRKGVYFKILGRLKDAEIRGCSDTFAKDHEAVSPVSTNNESDENEIDVFDKITYLVGNNELIKSIDSIRPFEPFSEKIMSFLDDLSKLLMKDKEAKAYPDLITLGFWLRKSSIEQMKERFYKNDDVVRVGRGVAFHIAPSNVAVNYAYTLFAGLLSGNANIVRVPTRDYVQVNIINRLIEQVLNEHEEVRPYIVLIRYDRNKAVNDKLSSMCNIRVIWGGDETIQSIRKSPLPSRTTEIVFADRYSLAVIDSDVYYDKIKDETGLKERKRIAGDFYNDTYLTDQNACTSPRMIIWTGNHVDEARDIFWDELLDIVRGKYELPQVRSVDKLVNECMTAADGCNVVRSDNKTDNRLIRLEASDAVRRLMDHQGNCGYFYEYVAEDLMEIRELCDDPKCQTISYLGNKDMLNPLICSGLKGVDRVVPIGHTMDFDLIWDGYNLVEQMTRTIAEG